MSTADEKIVLGSGKLYTMLFNDTIPDDKTIETNENLLGLISGGADLEYKPKFYEVEDDLGIIRKSILTEETVTLKSGVLTWNGKTLARLCSTARVSEDKQKGKRTVKIGGLANYDGKLYVIRFVHEDKADGNIRVTIVGNNQAGFGFKFTKGKETVVDAEFQAAPMDDEGTKIIYEEDIPQVTENTIGALNVVSTAGSTTGKTKIAVTPTLSDGNSYMYKIAANTSIPKLNDVCNTTAGYTAWNGTDEITAVSGNDILIVEVDSSFKAVNAGKATVTSKTV
ncbi:hypothetical protein [Clostridium sp. 001]|uniref:hypothetical protein n=1 Tax=Clostridium sp. 001 TaxID=1970093 RepID=UPI001C2BCB31